MFTYRMHGRLRYRSSYNHIFSPVVVLGPPVIILNLFTASPVGLKFESRQRIMDQDDQAQSEPGRHAASLSWIYHFEEFFDNERTMPSNPRHIKQWKLQETSWPKASTLTAVHTSSSQKSRLMIFLTYLNFKLFFKF